MLILEVFSDKKLLPAKNIVGENVFLPNINYVGKRLYHSTKKLNQILKSKFLKPKPDFSGTKDTWHRTLKDFRPVMGIFCSTNKDAWQWEGWSTVSFIVKPSESMLFNVARA